MMNAISVRAPAALYPHLHDTRPKLVVVGPCPAPLPAWIEKANLLLLRAERSPGGAEFALVAEPAEPEAVSWLDVPVPPTETWLVCAPTPGAKEDALAFLGWWSDAGGEPSVPALHTGSLAEARDSLLDRALATIDRLHMRNHAMQRDLSALRGRLSSTVRIPPELHELLDNLRISPTRMIFAGPVSEAAVAVPAAGGWLAQRLPAWARGLAGVDLHVASKGPHDGALVAVLAARDSGMVLGHWLVGGADLARGWIPLRLNEACARQDRTVDLLLSWSGTGAAPRLSLSPAGLLDEFALDDEAAQASGAEGPMMLALRVWGSVPGFAHGRTFGGASPSPVQAFRVAVPDHAVAQAERTRALAASFNWFAPLGKGRLLLHPIRREVSSARVPLPDFGALGGVSCDVTVTDSRFASVVECRLVVTRPGTAADQAQAGVNILASSGWIGVDAPGVGHRLEARLTESWVGAAEAHLFTRIADGGYGNYAHTVFSRFEVELRTDGAESSRPAVSAACVA